MEGSLEGGTSRGVLSTNPLAAASSETRQNDLHVEDPEGSRVSCVAQRGEVWSHQRIRTFAAATDRRHDDLVARAIRVDPDPGRSRTGSVRDLHAHSPDHGPAASWLRRGQSHLHRPAAPTVRRIRPCSTSGPLVPCARRQERDGSFNRRADKVSDLGTKTRILEQIHRDTKIAQFFFIKHGTPHFQIMDSASLSRSISIRAERSERIMVSLIVARVTPTKSLRSARSSSASKSISVKITQGAACPLNR